MSTERPPSGAERRQHERFELLAQVDVLRSGQSETLTVINISAGGVLLRNDRNVELAMGEPVRVQFAVPELAPTFAIDGKVIRIVAPTAKPALIAAMWTSRDPGASAALAELLWNLSRRG